MSSSGIYELIIEPQGELYLEYSKIDITLESSMKWICSIEELV